MRQLKIDTCGDGWFDFAVYEKRWWGWKQVRRSNYLWICENYVKERVGLPKCFPEDAKQ